MRTGWACCTDLPQTSLCFPLTGKSALHWAAAVNNVEAAVVLLKNGANKDMQNNKVGAMWVAGHFAQSHSFLTVWDPWAWD